MIHYGDITKLSGYHLIPVDVITGGSPCQNLSIAGNRKGLRGEQSSLFLHQIRIVKELRHTDRDSGRTGIAIRPRYMVWENVPGAFSSNKGEDFRKVIEEIVRIAEPQAPDVPMPKKGKWPKAGCIYDELGNWSIAWRVHDAQFWGVPQRRKRIALVADFGGITAPEILFERKGVPGDSESGGAQREDTTETFRNRTDGTISFQERAGCPGGGKGILIQNDRIGALSTTNNQFVFDAIGNGDGKTVCTITGDHNNRVTDYTALCFTDQFHGDYKQSDKSGTETARQCKGTTTLIVAASVDCRNLNENPEVSGTLQSKNTGGYSLNYQNPVRIHGRVRRLTPLECERLQGYPDGWTDIGEWVDGKGKKRKASDSARYKALGNSIALPFWHWLLKRISAQYEECPTLGSLFDGIVGFPLCWEKINGTGSAIWASEIEEFPIAVTKKRFG